MKTIAFATAVVLAALAAAPAMAADMPVRTPAYIPAPVWTWTGFYEGINGGGSLGHSATTDTQVFASAAVAGGPVTLANEGFNHSPLGGVFGGQIGANWQIDRYVLGAEADWQWAGVEDTARLFSCGGQTAAFFVVGGQAFNQCLSDNQKLQSFGTARLRAGVATGEWLWYVTGGAAWGDVKSNLTLSIASVPGLGNPLIPGTTIASFSHDQPGWTVGAGIETRLWGGFTAKLEYLYLDLGSYTDTFTIPAAAPGATLATTSTSHFTDHIIRVGLNYRLF
jgi:outer membrane immunogenic protein